MDVVQLNGGLVKVVIAHDAFRLAIATNRLGNIIFEVHIFRTSDDGFTQNGLTLFFGSKPAASIGASTAGDHDRSRSAVQKSSDVRTLSHVVDTQFNKFGSLFGEGLVLFNHGRMAGPSEAYADHYKTNPSDDRKHQGGHSTPERFPS